jgi:hypothetical protein
MLPEHPLLPRVYNTRAQHHDACFRGPLLPPPLHSCIYGVINPPPPFDGAKPAALPTSIAAPAGGLPAHEVDSASRFTRARR